MAVNGALEGDHFPYLPLTLVLGENRYAVEALIDTGFEGDVVIPSATVAGAEPPDGQHAWILADGSEVFAPYYLGSVQIGELRPFPALITTLGEEPLIGRGITDRLRLILDHGRRVTVES